MSDDQEWNKKVIAEFRSNAGKVGGHFTGKTLLLLHTTGAKSGKEFVNPVAYVRTEQNDFAIIASNSGLENHPSWYHNLLAHPQVEIEVGSERLSVIAKAAEEPEYSYLYDKMVEMMPVFGKYQEQATRKIPVVVLQKVEL
jgi:deazaflavin-dependent oxidoreductase (nitroreductase family)